MSILLDAEINFLRIFLTIYGSNAPYVKVQEDWLKKYSTDVVPVVNSLINKKILCFSSNKDQLRITEHGISFVKNNVEIL